MNPATVPVVVDADAITNAEAASVQGFRQRQALLEERMKSLALEEALWWHKTCARRGLDPDAHTIADGKIAKRATK